jgi:hypothetical protein
MMNQNFKSHPKAKSRDLIVAGTSPNSLSLSVCIGVEPSYRIAFNSLLFLRSHPSFCSHRRPSLAVSDYLLPWFILGT